MLLKTSIKCPFFRNNYDCFKKKCPMREYSSTKEEEEEDDDDDDDDEDDDDFLGTTADHYLLPQPNRHGRN